MNTIFIVSVICFIICVVTFIILEDDVSCALVIISGIIFFICAYLDSNKCKHKSNVIDRYEQLTSKKPASKKPDIDENHISKNNVIIFNIVEVNNEYVAKLTFHDVQFVKIFFDLKHKCSVKECASNHRKYVQNSINQYAIKKLDITWPNRTYTVVSTNTIKLSEISMN